MLLDSKCFFYQYDLDATTYKYGRLGDNTGQSVQPNGAACTSGASTTLTSSTSDQYPYAGVDVGSPMVFQVPPDTSYIRKCATWTDNQNITVDTAITLGTTGRAFRFYPFHCGADDTLHTYGWHRVTGRNGCSVFVDIATLAAAGGVSVIVEGRGHDLGSATPIKLAEVTYSDADPTSVGVHEIEIDAPVQAIRVGLKAVTAATGTDSITVYLQERLPGD